MIDSISALSDHTVSVSPEQPSLHEGVVIVAHHPVVGRLQPGGVRGQLIRCEGMDASEGSFVGRLLAVDAGAAVDATFPCHDEDVPPRASTPNSQR
jgi:hypothetical protein